MAKIAACGTTTEKAAEKRVDFTFYAPLAKKVHLAGSFNNWQPSRASLTKDSTGNWKTTVSLKSGRYEYKFVVDGRWETDQKGEKVSNNIGSQNSILRV